MTGAAVLSGMLAAAQEKTPDKVAAIDYRRPVTFTELSDVAGRIAALLAQARPTFAVAHAGYARLARESLQGARLGEVTVLPMTGADQADSYESWWAGESPSAHDTGAASECVPLMLMRMLEAQAAEPRDVSSLELATCGGRRSPGVPHPRPRPVRRQGRGSRRRPMAAHR
jgi:hypothetical protein